MSIGSGDSSNVAYDEVVYPGEATYWTHPSHLGAVAQLCNLTAVPAHKARILELGCSLGNNILPIAAAFPDSYVLGIDFSSTQVALAARAISESGLQNAEVRCMSILDVNQGLGTFDYIICHGVYSWVPDDVRHKILQIGSQNLSPSGLMYISYNVFPGWHVPNLMRDAMRFHVEQFTVASDKIAEARAFLNFLASRIKTDRKAFDEIIVQEVNYINERLADLDYYLYHEFLEGLNQPYYFREFLEDCRLAGLSYVADATLRNLLASPVDPALPAPWSEGPFTDREQLTDYLTNRRFRRSIMCLPSQVPKHALDPRRLETLSVSFRTPVKVAKREGRTTYWANHRTGFASTSPLTEAFQEMQAAFPAWVPIQRLIQHVNQERQLRILRALLDLTAQGVTQFALQPVAIARGLPARPKALDFTRYRATAGQSVANLRHAELKLSVIQKFLLGRLDGRRTPQQLADNFHTALKSGDLAVHRDGSPVMLTSEQCLRAVQDELETLRQMAFILAE